MMKLLLIFVFALLTSNIWGKSIEIDSTIEFEAYKNCNIKITFFSQKSIFKNDKCCYFYFVVDSKFFPQKEISDYIQLFDNKGNSIKPYLTEISNSTTLDDSLSQHYFGILFYIFSESNGYSPFIKVLTNGVQEAININKFKFEPSNTKEFTILEFKKEVMFYNYLSSINKCDTADFIQIFSNSLVNDKYINNYYLLDKLKLNYQLYLKNISEQDYEKLTPFYETMYNKGNREIAFIKKYCEALENLSKYYADLKNCTLVIMYSQKLKDISSNIPVLSKFELASIFFNYYCTYETSNDSVDVKKYENLIEEIEQLKNKYENNVDYKYRFFLLLGNMNYMIENKSSAKKYYERIIESKDAPEFIKLKAEKNIKLISK